MSDFPLNSAAAAAAKSQLVFYLSKLALEQESHYLTHQVPPEYVLITISHDVYTYVRLSVLSYLPSVTQNQVTMPRTGPGGSLILLHLFLWFFVDKKCGKWMALYPRMIDYAFQTSMKENASPQPT